jgi:hypothetical protein
MEKGENARDVSSRRGSRSVNSLPRFDEDKQSQTRAFLVVVAVSCLELL